MTPNCTLSILAARTDVAFMRQTIAHIVHACRYPFANRVLLVDTAPLGRAYRDRPGIGSADELMDCCQELRDCGAIDRIETIDYSPKVRQHCYRRHFGRDLKQTHNFRGYPILGSLLAIERCQTEFLVHFDSDMLIHQSLHYDWILEGMQLINTIPEIMFVSPRSGPPGELKQHGVPFTHDARGFYRFSDFTSRKFMLNRSKLDALLPINPMYTSWRRRLLQVVTGQSALWNWEIMISAALRKTGFIRADLDSHDAWTLHTPDHGRRFVELLPDVIRNVEGGQFPAEQAGDYDLRLDLWDDCNNGV